MGSPKLADYPDVVCKTRQNGALKHALNGRCWRKAAIPNIGCARCGTCYGSQTAHPSIEPATSAILASRTERRESGIGGLVSGLFKRGVDQELAPAAARAGQALALQIGDRLDRRILANQDGLGAGVRAGAADGFDRRAGGVHGQESQISGVADVERPGVERFEDRRRGRNSDHSIL